MSVTCDGALFEFNVVYRADFESGLLPISDLESRFGSIEVSQKAVDRCAALVDAECKSLLPPSPS